MINDFVMVTGRIHFSQKLSSTFRRKRRKSIFAENDRITFRSMRSWLELMNWPIRDTCCKLVNILTAIQFSCWWTWINTYPINPIKIPIRLKFKHLNIWENSNFEVKIHFLRKVLARTNLLRKLSWRFLEHLVFLRKVLKFSFLRKVYGIMVTISLQHVAVKTTVIISDLVEIEMEILSKWFFIGGLIWLCSLLPLSLTPPA